MKKDDMNDRKLIGWRVRERDGRWFRQTTGTLPQVFDFKGIADAAAAFATGRTVVPYYVRPARTAVPAAPITNGDTVPLAQYQKLYADACESAMQHDHANAQVKASAARAEKAEKERDSFQRANAANVDIVMKLNAEVARLASALAASERRKDGIAEQLAKADATIAEHGAEVERLTRERDAKCDVCGASSAHRTATTPKPAESAPPSVSDEDVESVAKLRRQASHGASVYGFHGEAFIEYLRETRGIIAVVRAAMAGKAGWK